MTQDEYAKFAEALREELKEFGLSHRDILFTRNDRSEYFPLVGNYYLGNEVINRLLQVVLRTLP